jgi:hypothetical protein
MGSFLTNSFGTAIPPLGPNVGFIGQISRTNPRLVKSRQVLPTTATNLPFGAPAVLLPDSLGGKWQSVADFLASAIATNLPNLRNSFAGIAGREVKTQYSYLSLAQGAPTTYATTATGTSGTNSITVASATGIAVNQSVEGAGIPAGTYVTVVSGTTITLSQNLTAALSTTNVSFLASIAPTLGVYAAGEMADVLQTGSITVQITNGNPQAGNGVYIRTVANAALLGTSVGDLEAAADLVASPPTVGTTAGSTAVTVTNTSLAVGQQMTGYMFAPNTFIVALVSTTGVTISQPALLTVASAGVAAFSNTALLQDGFGDPWMEFSTGQIDGNLVCEVTIKGRYAA